MDFPEKVLQIVTRRQRRGAEVFAYDLSRAFEELGIVVKTLYLYDYMGENPLPLSNSDICLDGAENHFLERSLGFHPGLLRKVMRQVRTFRPDIVQVNGSRSVKYGAAAKQFSGTEGNWKLVYRNIGMPSDWHRGDDTILAYRFMIMPKMDGVIGVSRHSLTDALALYRLEGPAEVISNAISPKRLSVSKSREEVRAELQADDADFVLLFLGHLEDAKRPDRFLRTIARLSESLANIKGWIVGDGPLEAPLRQMVKTLGVEGKVSFLGNRSDVATYLAAADLLVLTSDTEGIPATVMEAAYLGLPVVATNVGGLSECVSHGSTGILVENEYERNLEEAIRGLASDAERRREMGENARVRAREEFIIDRIAKRYLEFYRSLSDQAMYAIHRGA